MGGGGLLGERSTGWCILGWMRTVAQGAVGNFFIHILKSAITDFAEKA